MDWVKGDQEDEERRIDDDIPVIPTKTMEEANSPGLFRRLFTTTEKPERVTRPKYLSSFISREQERKPDMTPIELEEWMTFYDEKYEEYLITPDKYNSPPIRQSSIMGSDQSIRQRDHSPLSVNSDTSSTDNRTSLRNTRGATRPVNGQWEQSTGRTHLLIQLLKGFTCKFHDPIIIFEDNKACQDYSKNSTNYQRTKHISVRYHFIRDLITDRLITLTAIQSEENIADIMTKPLDKKVFQHLRAKFITIIE